MADAYLVHHGILGQKWGVRRYQNKDGSYTTAGRKRLRINDSRLKRNDPIAKASKSIQNQTAKGMNVNSTQKFVKQAVISAALITAGVVATKAVLKSDSAQALRNMKMTDLVRKEKKGMSFGEATKAAHDLGLTGRAFEKKKNELMRSVKGGVDMKATMQYGKSATKVAISAIAAGALISGGASRGAGAITGYSNYLEGGRQGVKANREASRELKRSARQTTRRIVYR